MHESTGRVNLKDVLREIKNSNLRIKRRKIETNEELNELLTVAAANGSEKKWEL